MINSVSTYNEDEEAQYGKSELWVFNFSPELAFTAGLLRLISLLSFKTLEWMWIFSEINHTAQDHILQTLWQI